MPLEAILDSEEWTPELFNREIGREEFAELCHYAGGRGKIPAVRREYAKLFDELDKTPAREYLAEHGVTDLRHITERIDGQWSAFCNHSQGFGIVTGLWNGQQANQYVRTALVRHGIIEGRLENYDEKFQREIMKDSFNKNSVAADYFNPEVVGDETAEENLQVLFDSGIPRDYLAQQGITDLRHVTAKTNGKMSAFHRLTVGFGIVTKLWEGQKSGQDVRASLVRHDIIEGRLSNYNEDVQRDIMKDSFNHGSVAADYFNPTVVGEKIAEKNSRLFEQFKKTYLSG